jgi:uncharacterized protein YbaP (TraB family)
MRNTLVLTFCLALLAAPALAQTAPDAAPEQILIVGQRPGPGLWKVSKDDHVLWIFGTYSPLPVKMVWRSQQVETVLAQSQEFLDTPGTTVKVGFSQAFNLVTALPFAIGAKNNPDGARLQDVVPPDVYARWTVLKKKYIGDDTGIERERPIFAAPALFTKAMAQAGLGSDGEVTAALRQIAKKHNVKYSSTSIALVLDNPRGTLRDFKKSPMDDLACFTKTIDRLEVDLDAMRARANAWATGDVELMRKLSYPDQVSACNSAVVDSAVVKSLPGGATLEQRMRDTWLAAVEKALATNQSTFAMLPVSHIFSSTGLLADLQAKGYVVEQPD